MYIKNSKQYTLVPNDSHVSFYNKAWVEENVKTGTKYLYSYGTLVARMNKEGKLTRIWPGYSCTTMRHINAFAGRPIGKKEWENMKPVRIR